MAARKAPASRKGEVQKSVEAELCALKTRDDDLAGGVLAATAKALAKELDSARNSATSKSMVARELRAVMDRLRELAPSEEVKDGVDDLRERRKAKLARRAAAPATPRP